MQKSVKASSISTDMISFNESTVVSCCPANAYTKLPGIMPRDVVHANVVMGSLVTPAKILIKKKGNNGIKRSVNK